MITGKATLRLQYGNFGAAAAFRLWFIADSEPQMLWQGPRGQEVEADLDLLGKHAGESLEFFMTAINQDGETVADSESIIKRFEVERVSGPVEPPTELPKFPFTMIEMEAENLTDAEGNVYRGRLV